VCLGFVERLTSADDRRQCPLALTTAGKERLELGRADVRHFMVEVLNTLSEVDREGFTRNLREIGEYLAVHQG
jgi:DNA-binding MarR family transcriptional regulator